MIVQIGSDNIVKNTIVGDTLEGFADVDLFPDDTFTVVPGDNQVNIGSEWFADEQKTKDPQPYPSWTWNADDWQWKPPVTYPTDTITDEQWWDWDEDAYQADNADPNVWVLITETPPDP